MVREAQKAGLEFDEDKLEALNCWYDDFEFGDINLQPNLPPIVVDPGSPTLDSDGNGPQLEAHMNDTTGTHTNGIDSLNGTNSANGTNGATDMNGKPSTANAIGTKDENGLIKGLVDDDNIAPYHRHPPNTHFHKQLHSAATKGRIHDVLKLNNGVGTMSVFSWNVMEYMPFRRMDLRADGSWQAITWPLPKGETRDMPANALIHCSVIRRMIADDSYRPGNLIVGGGGRGIRQAPPEMGIGRWVVTREEGHAVGECFVRLEPPERSKTVEWARSSVPPGGPQGNYFSSR